MTPAVSIREYPTPTNQAVPGFQASHEPMSPSLLRATTPSEQSVNNSVPMPEQHLGLARIPAWWQVIAYLLYCSRDMDRHVLQPEGRRRHPRAASRLRRQVREVCREDAGVRARSRDASYPRHGRRTLRASAEVGRGDCASVLLHDRGSANRGLAPVRQEDGPDPSTGSADRAAENEGLESCLAP